jgi:hypothetical protein
MKWLHAAILASALLARTPPVFAQQSVEYGSIGGRVRDTSGAVRRRRGVRTACE